MEHISFLFRFRHHGPHVTVRVLAGPQPGQRGSCGLLTMQREEFVQLRSYLDGPGCDFKELTDEVIPSADRRSVTEV